MKDGEIHGQAVTKEYGYLQTVKKYKDFHLSLRFKCVGDGNSGVFFHTAFKAGTADVSQGLQFEIDPTLNHHTGGIYGDGRQWIVWPSPENEYAIHVNDWNDYMLKVEGNPYVARLNGIVVVDFTERVQGPYATQRLADFGADVIKIERPTAVTPDGRPDERYAEGDGPVPTSLYRATFLANNRNKRSIAVDLKSADGIATVKALVRSIELGSSLTR